ncbi:MAG: carbohydrate ABC transporter permease [Saccharofermentanales bacterium]
MNKYKIGARLFRGIIYILLIDLVFVFIYPFLYMMITSVKTYDDLVNILIKWIPSTLNFDNYRIAAVLMNVKVTLLNSVTMTGAAMVGHLVSCSFVGYGFARFNFPFKKILFIGMIFSIVVPVQTLIIPLYITYSNLGMMETFLPLIVPTFFGFGLRGGLFVFLFYQYFIRFPSSLEEAALIDGCGRIRGFFKIALPSAGSMIVVCLVLSMVWHWNDFFEPAIYLSSNGKTALLPQMLPEMYAIIQSMELAVTEEKMQLKFVFHEGVIMAGTVLSMAPLMIVYAFLQKKFMEGVERSGLVE